jgi:hypothetical protein
MKPAYFFSQIMILAYQNCVNKEGLVLFAGLVVGTILAVGWWLADWAGMVIALGVAMVSAA